MTDASTAALVAYLRCEADMAELKARRLNEQADALAQEHGETFPILDPSEMAPLNEFGVPKYKGKKRGRKPKPRQRQHNPNRKKRSHTAYTLFVQENHPAVRAQYPNLQSKDIIGIVARQWASVSEEEKQAWKQRAIATAVVADEGLEEEEEDDEHSEDESEDDAEPKKKRGRPKKK